MGTPSGVKPVLGCQPPAFKVSLKTPFFASFFFFSDKKMKKMKNVSKTEKPTSFQKALGWVQHPKAGWYIQQRTILIVKKIKTSRKVIGFQDFFPYTLVPGMKTDVKIITKLLINYCLEGTHHRKNIDWLRERIFLIDVIKWRHTKLVNGW